MVLKETDNGVCTMDLLPSGVISHIVSFLSVDDLSSCLISSPIFKSIGWSIDRHTIEVENKDAFRMLPRKLQAISSIMPCLQSIKIDISNIWSVLQDACMISMPKVQIELDFIDCSDEVIEQIPDLFKDPVKISIIWDALTGNEKFLKQLL